MTTHVLFVTDMSGSMNPLAEDVRGGFNAYLDTLAADDNPDTAYRLTVCLFDDQFIPLCTNTPLSDTPRLTTNNYRPRGMTALMDAVGLTVNQFISRVPTLASEDKVLTVIQTDGAENASREYTRTMISTLIKELEETGKWSFIFLGAGITAWQQASGMGFQDSNTVRTRSTSKGTRDSYAVLANATISYSKGATGAETAAEIQEAVGDE